MEYTVKDSDTLARIAAFHDCTISELMKLNKLGSRMIFPGQKLLVPSFTEKYEVSLGNHVDSASPLAELESLNIQSGAASENATVSTLNTNDDDGIRKGPGIAILKTPTMDNDVAQIHKSPKNTVKDASLDEDVDTDCLRRFLKIKVKKINEKTGTVSGTLLVTPNALMFDPDVNHPLVIENGQEIYIMMARMEDIACIALYKERHETVGKDTYTNSAVSSCGNLAAPLDDESGSRQIKDSTAGFEFADSSNGSLDSYGSYLAKLENEPINNLDSGEIPVNQILSRANELQFSPFVNNDLDKGRSASLHGKSEDAHANSIRGTVASSAERMTQTAVSGTMTVAHGVASHTKSAAGSLQTGIQASAKLAATHAKVAVDVVASMPQGIAMIGSELFSDGQQTSQQLKQMNEKATESLRCQQNLATLKTLQEKTILAREKAKKERGILFSCATSLGDEPDLFRHVDELLGNRSADMPCYMTVRLKYALNFEQRNIGGVSCGVRELFDFREYDANFEEILIEVRFPVPGEDNFLVISQEDRFWFAIPSRHVDSLYYFLLQWAPERNSLENMVPSHGKDSNYVGNNHSFVDFNGTEFLVLNSNTDDKLAGIFIARISAYKY
ncbi:unnamed protein product [Dracunculus medinensis]|uniref:LysM domain-containing protein n=1 Tax=Dracunculus medinensis TaxID=318479 RepID=A0A0N4UCQ9_DRAME|nr:unnamed protein product [Dracunculus medinensis]